MFLSQILCITALLQLPDAVFFLAGLFVLFMLL